MISENAIKELALANGFKLKEQPDGSMELNPYVYEFAQALIAHALADKKVSTASPFSAALTYQIEQLQRKGQALLEERGIANITSLAAYRDKKNGPDADLVCVDDGGVEWFTYGVDYKDKDGKRLSFHIWATSMSDAKERVAAIKDNAALYGQILADNL